MLKFPKAKINLGLYITEKRNDGYHNLVSCFYPIAWNDVLEFIPQSPFQFKSTGIPIPGNSDNNLVTKAYQLLQKDFNIPDIQIHLHKIIPMGAGLGGGSSDAAAMLKGLNQVFHLQLTTAQLCDYALQLGSDCPFFIYEQACIAKGRGEILSPIHLHLNGYYLLLINPQIHISTQEAYQGVSPKALDFHFQELLLQDPTTWKGRLHNQFEDHLFKNHPTLVQIKNALYEQGAVYASMSGSGSTMYGLFKEKPNHAWCPEHYLCKVMEL